MMSQAMEAVVRFLSEEAVSFLAGYAVSLVLGLSPRVRGVLPLPSLEAPAPLAPSAEVTTASITLSRAGTTIASRRKGS